MTINQKLKEYYALVSRSGHIPSTIGVSEEEYDDYNKSLREMAELLGLVWTDKPTKLTYNDIELKVYGKKHTDEKLQRQRK